MLTSNYAINYKFGFIFSLLEGILGEEEENKDEEEEKDEEEDDEEEEDKKNNNYK